MRRIAAIVLPQLACELVRQRGPISPSGKAPLAVLLEPTPRPTSRTSQGAPRKEREPAPATATLDVVDDDARRYGVRPGQRVVEAAALVAHLAIHRVTFDEMDAALGRVAEVALSLGATAAIRLGAAGDLRRGADDAAERTAWGRGPFDTVWLDITGAAHLVGGEEALCDELGERVAALGHRARIAIADGPRLAQALARWSPHAFHLDQSPAIDAGAGRHPIVPPGHGAQAVAPLPVHALPVEPEIASFLVRLGLLRVGDVARLPRASAAARLGARTREVTALMAGYDPTPLVPFEPPRLLEEETSFDDGVENAESLLFVLRGMTSRVAARLAARGEACGRLDVTITYDRSIARLRRDDNAQGRAQDSGDDADDADDADDVDNGGDRSLASRGHAVDPDEGLALQFHVELPVPLSDANDLLRPLKARLERTELAAPAVGLRLTTSGIVPARRVQLDLSRDQSIDPDSLPALLAELSAEIGADRVGILEIVDAHCPEARSRLAPAEPGKAAARPAERGEAPEGRRGAGPLAAPPGKPPLEEPARLLAKPIPLGRVGRGAIVAIDRHLYAIEQMRFVMRLDGVAWWTPAPASRDYARVWLASGSPAGKGPVDRWGHGRAGRAAPDGASASTCGEAWIYVDRATGEGFLQGWCE